MQSKNIVSILKSNLKQYKYIDDTYNIESYLIGISINIRNDTIIFSNVDMEYGDNKFYLLSYSNLYNFNIDVSQIYMNLLIIDDSISKDIKQDVSGTLVIMNTDDKENKEYKDIKIFKQYYIQRESIFVDNQEYQIYKQIIRNRFGNKYRTSNYCIDSNNKTYYYLFIVKDLRTITLL